MGRYSWLTAAVLVVPFPALAQIVIVDPPKTVLPAKPFEGDLTKFVPTKADRSKSDWDKVECRSQDVTGSRLERHQVCLTRWQWWAYEQEDKQRLQELQVIGFFTRH